MANPLTRLLHVMETIMEGEIVAMILPPIMIFHPAACAKPARSILIAI